MAVWAHNLIEKRRRGSEGKREGGTEGERRTRKEIGRQRKR